MDTFIAALKVGPRGKVIGVDMTDEQRAKAERLRDRDGFTNVTYVKGYIENVPAPAASVDVVISNGVINLATDKSKVFKEAARLLKPGGRFAISDIVTEVQLPETIVCNSTLWAACIGGAAQQDNYRAQITAAGMRRKTRYFAAFFASIIQVDTTVSGLSEMLSMPCSTSHCARSGWSDGPCPQMPT